ncbi:MAG: tRNA pseudouridine(38-40) synthase TruA [Candidatus Marinimicrobia bacterium]|nr:tRNA pseudouridine(38-40) synthase TruA [Candidatus Neomarinimicrobiota bacterium]MDD5581788.1 tRNA pseudouridine(38-40) synthase TruA [Candidatus Neomarinimicrobiota bacterium]
MPKKRFAFLLEYEGTNYCGFQLQPNQPTIQYEVECAIKALFQEDIRIIGSSRTDSGVHAKGQVFHADLPDNIPCSNLGKALNMHLPHDIRIKGVALVDDKFNARYQAVSRCYRYTIYKGITALYRHYSWLIYQPLNVSAMKECLPKILGFHNFTSFCLSQTETEDKQCTVQRATWEEINEILIFKIQANHFLHAMVRSLVGTMVDVGRGRYSVQDFDMILNKQNHGSGAVTAPAKGLILEEVIYNPQIPWQWSGVCL